MLRLLAFEEADYLRQIVNETVSEWVTQAAATL